MSKRLTPELVLYGYANGIFPMEEPGGQISWFSPDPRCIFEVETFRPSRSLRKRIAAGEFEVAIDRAFEGVIDACADRPRGTWIHANIRRTYLALHRMGCAHSVEAWQVGKLAGGLYGVAISGAFFGESMFHRATDASKVALAALIEHMRDRGMSLLDCQWNTPHLRSLGAIDISRDEYMTRLESALQSQATFR